MEIGLLMTITKYKVHVDSISRLTGQIDSTHIQGWFVHLDLTIYTFVERIQVGLR